MFLRGPFLLLNVLLPSIIPHSAVCIQSRLSIPNCTTWYILLKNFVPIWPNLVSIMHAIWSQAWANQSKNVEEFKIDPEIVAEYHQRWVCLQQMEMSEQNSNVYLYKGDEVKQASTILVKCIIVPLATSWWCCSVLKWCLASEPCLAPVTEVNEYWC